MTKPQKQEIYIVYSTKVINSDWKDCFLVACYIISFESYIKYDNIPLADKMITFKFKGKTYSAKTDKNGIARVTIKKNVIKKLKAGGKYTAQVSYLHDTIKTTVKVKKVLSSKKIVTVKKEAKNWF